MEKLGGWSFWLPMLLVSVSARLFGLGGGLAACALWYLITLIVKKFKT